MSKLCEIAVGWGNTYKHMEQNKTQVFANVTVDKLRLLLIISVDKQQCSDGCRGVRQQHDLVKEVN